MLIDGMFMFLFNLYWDLRDMREGKMGVNINSNIITLYCAISEDIPIDMRNQYCKSLEVVYACMIRAILSTADRSRFNGTTKDIFQSIPILNSYDKVKMKKNQDSMINVLNWFTNGKTEVSAKEVIDTFTESYQERLSRYWDEKIALESGDVILKEARGAVPTFVNIGINVYQLNGRPVEKTISVGIEVRPKVVSNEELVSMIIKKNLPKPDGKTLGIFGKMKSVFSFNSKRPEMSKVPVDVKKDLNTLLDSVKHVQKPFVCILLSNVAKEMLENARINITNSAVVHNLYKQLPIMSISVYDSNTDLIHSSLTRDSYFVTRTAAEFNSDISNMERQLAEVVRVNRNYGI